MARPGCRAPGMGLRRGGGRGRESLSEGLELARKEGILVTKVMEEAASSLFRWVVITSGS